MEAPRSVKRRLAAILSGDAKGFSRLMGEVVAEGDRIYGDGVNVAARVERLAKAGGICISGSVYDQVKNKLTLAHEDLGCRRSRTFASRSASTE